jgi:hypothetical protein
MEDDAKPRLPANHSPTAKYFHEEDLQLIHLALLSLTLAAAET